MNISPNFENKYILGATMMCINIGSRFIINELNDKQKMFLTNNKIIRKIVIFLLLFVYTKDIFKSLILTIIFIFLIKEFFNEDGDYSILNKIFDYNDYKIKNNSYIKKGDKILTNNENENNENENNENENNENDNNNYQIFDKLKDKKNILDEIKKNINLL
jgi:hypothetical protein